MLFFMGIIFTMATTVALDLERNNAGSASALIGFFSFLAGGIAAPITGIGNMLYSTAGILAVFGPVITLGWTLPTSCKYGRYHKIICYQRQHESVTSVITYTYHSIIIVSYAKTTLGGNSADTSLCRPI